MEELRVTLIDVGWGDSILIEFETDTEYKCGLIDSNDGTNILNTYNFLDLTFKKMEKTKGYKLSKPYFEFVMMSHDHSDHASGLKRIMRKFGTKSFYYSEPYKKNNLAILLDYVKRVRRLGICANQLKKGIIFKMGKADFEVLWPDTSVNNNENNNSIVLCITFAGNKVLLTGDVETSVWNDLMSGIPKDINVIKLPHHGSKNGFFHNTKAVWETFLSTTPKDGRFGISTNPSPFDHPDQPVIDYLDRKKTNYYRTDIHSHVTFIIDSRGVRCRYSHED